MMRTAATLLALAVVLLAACGPTSSAGPAWPKSAGRVEVDPEKDGGESLEPQQASHIAAVERTEDRTPAVGKEAIVVEAPSPAKGEAKVEPNGEAKGEPKVETIEVIEIKPEDIVIDR